MSHLLFRQPSVWTKDPKQRDNVSSTNQPTFLTRAVGQKAPPISGLLRWQNV